MTKNLQLIPCGFKTCVCCSGKYVLGEVMQFNGNMYLCRDCVADFTAAFAKKLLKLENLRKQGAV